MRTTLQLKLALRDNPSAHGVEVKLDNVPMVCYLNSVSTLGHVQRLATQLGKKYRLTYDLV